MAINPIIKQKAEDIRKKIFGSEVRESLASGIEAISEDVEATIGRQGYVEEQFQDVLDETTGKDVISAPELIAARNGKSNLKTRLDDEHAQVTAQLQQKANQIEVSEINGRVENIIINGTPTEGNTTLLDAAISATGENFGTAGTNIRKTQTGEALLPESVKPHTTTFFNNEGNFFNPDEINVDTILDGNGSMVFNATYCTSKFILLNPGVYAVNSVRKISKYTLAKVHVETIDVNPSASRSFQILEKCYIRISINKSTVSNTTLVLGQNAPASYAPPKYVLANDFYVGKKNILEPLDIELLDIARPFNYFNKETVIRDYMVGTQAGGLSQSEATIGIYAATDFIKVTPDVYFLTRNRNVVLYDEKKGFKSSYTTQQNQITISENGFMRITLYIDDIDTTIVTKGTPPSGYTPYGQYVLNDNLKLKPTNLIGSQTSGEDIMVHFGDSNTANGNLVTKIASLTGMTHYNFGIGGTRLVDLENPSNGFQKLNFLDLLRAKTSGDWTKVDTATAEINATIITDKINEFKALNMSSVKYLAFMFGTNDIAGSTITLGDANSSATTSVNGALNTAFNLIFTHWPHLRVYAFAPIFRPEMPYSDPVQNSDEWSMNGEFKLHDIASAIGAKSKEFKTPFKNLYYESGINALNSSAFISDGTHLNAHGDDLVGEKMARFIISN